MDIPEALLRHFVALDIVQETCGKEKKQIAGTVSGCLLDLGETLFYLTAGHVLKQLNTNIQAGAARIVIARFVDRFGPRVPKEQLLPFEYVPRRAIAMYEEEYDVDFGLIILDDLYRNIFNSSGKLPITEKDLLESDVGPHCDEFGVLGVPEEFSTFRDTGRSFARSVTTALIPVEVIHEGTLSHATGRAPRLQGRVRNDAKLKSLKGTSGGPVFGFTRSKPDKYFIVGIQSAWDRSTRTAYICPLQVIWLFLGPVAAKIRELRRQHDAKQSAGPPAGD